MAPPLLRLTVSPSLGGGVMDELRRSGAQVGRILLALHDLDVGASTLTVQIEARHLTTLAQSLVAPLRGETSPGAALRFEFLGDDPAQLPAEEEARDLAASLGKELAAPAFFARRTIAPSAWAGVRPMPWGRKGLAVGHSAPLFAPNSPFRLGVALEIGAPTVVVKARLESVPEHGLVRACRAVGGPESGFVEVGAYAGISATDGTSLAILEFGNVARSPIHRALDVIDIESRRYGGRLGACALLSHMPLDSLLGTLAAHTGLGAQPSQILETRLPSNAFSNAEIESRQ